MSAQGLRVLPSRHGAVETLERLEAVIVRQGMTVFITRWTGRETPHS
jgi:hypothetical protein